MAQSPQKAVVIRQTLVGSDHEASRRPVRRSTRAEERAASIFAADAHLGLLLRATPKPPARAAGGAGWFRRARAAVHRRAGRFMRAHKRPFFWATCGAGSAKTKRGRFQRQASRVQATAQGARTHRTTLASQVRGQQRHRPVHRRVAQCSADQWSSSPRSRVRSRAGTTG